MRLALATLTSRLLLALTGASALAASGCARPGAPEASEVTATMKSHRKELIEVCWLPEKHAHPTLEEIALPVTFAIGPEGTPYDVRVDEDAGASSALARCVAAQVRSFRFPEAVHGALSVRHVFYFQSKPDLPPSLTW